MKLNKRGEDRGKSKGEVRHWIHNSVPTISLWGSKSALCWSILGGLLWIPSCWKLNLVWRKIWSSSALLSLVDVSSILELLILIHEGNCSGVFNIILFYDKINWIELETFTSRLLDLCLVFPNFSIVGLVLCLGILFQQSTNYCCFWKSCISLVSEPNMAHTGF